jgi:hypothetical protein
MPDTIPTSLKTPIPTRHLTLEGLSIRFAESESRHEHPLLLSPWPESLFASEPTWAAFAGQAQAIGVDVQGFGHSDGREDLLPPRAMSDWFFALCGALIFAGLWGMVRLGGQHRRREFVDLMLSLPPVASSRYPVEEWRDAWPADALSDDEVSRRFDGMRRGWAA